jgi:hypothetical protein
MFLRLFVWKIILWDELILFELLLFRRFLMDHDGPVPCALTLHCPTKLQVEVILGTHAWRFEERRNTIRLSVNIVNKASQ